MTVHTSDQRPHSAPPSGMTWRSSTARIGWIVLLTISLGGLLNHLIVVVAAIAGLAQLATLTHFRPQPTDRRP